MFTAVTRPALTAATAAAVALAPVVAPLGAQHPAALQTVAAELPGLDFPALPDLVTDAIAATSPIGQAIEAAYLAVEEWVQYGVNLVAWAAGWVPFVGLLAPQINFVYTLGESVVQSGLFNTIDVLDGSISIGQGFSNFATDTAAAFNAFIQTEINWVLHFFPPPPPVDALTDLAALDPGLPDVDALGTDLATALVNLAP